MGARITRERFLRPGLTADVSAIKAAPLTAIKVVIKMAFSPHHGTGNGNQDGNQSANQGGNNKELSRWGAWLFLDDLTLNYLILKGLTLKEYIKELSVRGLLSLMKIKLDS